MAKWFVTAPHLDIRDPAGRHPLGIRHARRSQDAYTACGIPTMNWRTFWHLPFDRGSGHACVDCLRAVYEASSRKHALTRASAS